MGVDATTVADEVVVVVEVFIVVLVVFMGRVIVTIWRRPIEQNPFPSVDAAVRRPARRHT